MSITPSNGSKMRLGSSGKASRKEKPPLPETSQAGAPAVSTTTGGSATGGIRQRISNATTIPKPATNPKRCTPTHNVHRLNRGRDTDAKGRALLRGGAAAQKRRGGPVERVLRVNALATFSVRWLLPRLTLFREEHSGIEVQLTTANEPVDALPEEYDVAIRGGPDTFYGFVSRPLLNERRLPVCSPTLIKQHPLTTVAGLERHTLLLVGTMPNPWRAWLTVGRLGGIEAGGNVDARSLLPGRSGCG